MNVSLTKTSKKAALRHKKWCKQLFAMQNQNKIYIDNNSAISSNNFKIFMPCYISFFPYKGEGFYYVLW